jgi:hypothetical protein
VTIPTRFILYLSYITPNNISPSTTSQAQYKQLQEVSLFHIVIWSPSTMYPHVLSFHASTQLVPPDNVHILQSGILLLIFRLMCKGVSQCIPLWVHFTLVCSTPFVTLPYLFSPLPHFSVLSAHILIFFTFKDVVVYNITDYYSLFLSLFPLVPYFFCKDHISK